MAYYNLEKEMNEKQTIKYRYKNLLTYATHIAMRNCLIENCLYSINKYIIIYINEPKKFKMMFMVMKKTGDNDNQLV